MSKLNVALTIAGTDPSGGAGVMADLKTFQARDVYGMAVITSVVAQNTCGVKAIQNIDLNILDAQLQCVFNDITPDAIKTGMLAKVEMIELIADYLKKQNSPYVLDPVMVATSGDRLIDEQAIATLTNRLFPLATVATPNLPEASVLFGRTLVTEDDILKAGPQLQKEYGIKNIVIKGGHLEKEAVDYLFLENNEVVKLSSERFNTKDTHGTGCTYAAVICAELAKGKSVKEALFTAKRFIHAAIKHAPGLGKGNGPVNHIVYKGD